MEQLAEMTAYVKNLTHPDSGMREAALLELSKKREDFPDLAPMLWHSFGTIAVLLQEIIAIYPALSPPNLSATASNRVCNALALLQCVASHQETRALFLSGTIDLGVSFFVFARDTGSADSFLGCCPSPRVGPPPPSRAAHIPLYLYPFLNTASRSKPFEYLRLTSLGVIGALVKVREATLSVGAQGYAHDFPCGSVSHAAWSAPALVFIPPLDR